MDLGIVGDALEREHREIDAGIEAFTASLEAGQPQPSHLLDAIAALRRHIYVEEEFLFPPMQESHAIPTLVMLREHGEIWRNLDTLEQQIAETGGDQATVDTCLELLSRLAAHNGKEEPIFYTEADGKLEAAQSDELISFLKQGTMPDGWICRTAIIAE